jgi:thiol-disulfide isomerase/thioredoxin
MSLCNDLVKVLSLGGIEGGQAKVINNEKIGGEILFDPLFPGVICPPCQEETEEFSSLDEEDVIAETTCLMTESLGNVTFSNAGRTVKKNMLLTFDEGAIPQVPDEFSVELWIESVIKPFEALFFFERGAGEPELKFLGLPSFDLILDYELEEFDITEGGTLGLLKPEIETFKNSTQMEGFQLFLEVVIEIHAATSFFCAK